MPKKLNINLTKTELSIIVESLYSKIVIYRNTKEVDDDYLEMVIKLYQKLKDIKNN